MKQKLRGSLKVVVDASRKTNSDLLPSPGTVQATGWAEYEVEGMKPSIFNMAPPIVLTTAVDMIEDNLAKFITQEFGKRFSAAFRKYLLEELQKKQGATI